MQSKSPAIQATPQGAQSDADSLAGSNLQGKCSLGKLNRTHVSSARLESKTERITITMPRSGKNSTVLYLERYPCFLDLDHAIWEKVCKQTQAQTESLPNKVVCLF